MMLEKISLYTFVIVLGSCYARSLHSMNRSLKATDSANHSSGVW